MKIRKTFIFKCSLTVTTSASSYVMLQKANLEHHQWCMGARGEVASLGNLTHLMQQVMAAPTHNQPYVFTRHATIRGHLTVFGSSYATQVGLLQHIIAALM